MHKPNILKRLVQLAWLLPLMIGSFYAMNHTPHSAEYGFFELAGEEEEDEGPQYDRPDLAVLQEIEKTRDPRFERVPTERRKEAIAETKRRWKLEAGGRMEASIANVTWTQRGPGNVGGRTKALLWDPNDLYKKKVWAAAAGGGLWYTSDITVASPAWYNVSDLWSDLAVTSLAYDPTNPQILYAGTGEGFGNADAIRGDGIWKSVNGGASWSQLAFTDNHSAFYYVQKLAVTSTGKLLAATNSGLLVSNDKGVTWASLVSGFMADIEIAANGTVYASSGRYGSAGNIYRSTDGGVTFTTITPAGGTQERIELATAPSSAGVVYAVAAVATNVSWLKKSVDGGTTWTSLPVPKYLEQNCVISTTNDYTRGQAWYDLVLAVKPDDANTLFAGGIDINRYSAGAWSTITYWTGGCAKPYVHADQHAISFRPGFPNEAIFGNDGGIYHSNNLSLAAPTFGSRNNGYNVTQFYYAAAHPASGSHYFLAGAQDNGTQRFNTAGINATTEVTGGDGAFCFINQKNPAYQVTAYTNNYYYVSANGGASFGTLSSAGDGQFINPADLDDNLNTLYTCAGTNTIRRIVLAPVSNTLVSVAIGSSTPSHLKVSPYATTTSTLFIGTKTGRIYKVANVQAGTSLGATDITGNISVPLNSNVSCIEVGASENELLAIYSNYGVQSVWYTANGGASWTSLDNGHGLPDMPIRWALFNPLNRAQVLLATEAGVWSSSDIRAIASSTFWQPTNANLANVRVDMLDYRASDKLVVVATHGRGLYTGYPFTGGVPMASARTDGSGEASVGQPYEVSVYPNPSTGHFTLRFTGDAEGAVNIKVNDAIGREVKTFSITRYAGAFEETLDLNSLENGVYLLQINDGKNRAVKRIVKQ